MLNTEILNKMHYDFFPKKYYDFINTLETNKENMINDTTISKYYYEIIEIIHQLEKLIEKNIKDNEKIWLVEIKYNEIKPLRNKCIDLMIDYRNYQRWNDKLSTIPKDLLVKVFGLIALCLDFNSLNGVEAGCDLFEVFWF